MADTHFQEKVSAMSLFELSKIIDQEHQLAKHLSRAIQTARNGHTMSRADRRLLKDHAAAQLLAVNEKARVAWGNAICLQIERHFDITDEHLHPGQPVYLLTLVDLACCTPPDGKSIDLDFIAAQLRHGLKGLSYVGMIEPAYYVNIAPGTNVQSKRLVSWHLHAVAWGKTQRRMRRLISRLNRMDGYYQPIANNRAGAHFRTIRKNTLPKTLAYILKSPTLSYRIASWYQLRRDGKRMYEFKQNKGRLRPGERVTLFNLMKHMRLDQLAMAGGEGNRLLRRATRHSLRILNRESESEYR
jgi:hypothetical protein